MQKNRQTKPLTERQIFTMKRDTLEQRLISYFDYSQNSSAIIEYAIAIMVRNSLILSDYSFMAQSLIRELFLTAAPSDVMRRYCLYFENYFEDGKEWQKVKERLFKNQAEFQQFTEEARLYRKLLDTPGAGERKNPDLTLRWVSVFEDAAGKKHRMTLRDADETKTKAEVSKILEILTTLSIFKKADGVRRFVNFVKISRPGTIETLEEEELAQKLQEESVQIIDTFSPEPIEIVVPTGITPSDLSEVEVLALVQVAHPDVVSLANIQVVFIEEDLTMQEPAETTPILKDSMKQNSHGPDSISDIKTQDNVAGTDLPNTKKRKRSKPLTNKEAYKFNLISNWRARHAQN
ncbi:hypothetical protein [Enterococcus sp. AZ196]|uniref:DUF2922 family protein n=1 Tax=Enterococcus sp. AZ196 TaxID=2774659 RepID=UPI003D2BADEB